MTCLERFALNYHQAYQDVYWAAFNSAIPWYGEAYIAHQVALSAVKMHSAIHRDAFV
ncbi:ChaB [Nodularia spumigena CCY9414]|nr:ChaB [Nodularia spumigena CCY9414]